MPEAKKKNYLKKEKHGETRFSHWGEWQGKQNNGGDELEERKR